LTIKNIIEMLEISKKEHILVPFNKIGEENWKANTRIILESLAENFDDELAEPVSDDQIAELEKRLGTDLPSGLKLFYKTFGIAEIGEELQSFDDLDWIKNIWADAPEYGPDFTEEDQRSLPYLITFSDYLGNGNMFCFHTETKEIYYFDHDSAPYITKIFKSVDDYLKGCLVFAQTELSADEQVEKWAEEIVVDLLGKDVVRKWRY